MFYSPVALRPSQSISRGGKVAQTIPNIQLDFDSLPDSAFIRLKLLIALRIVPYSSSTLWRKVRSGEFPSPVKVSSGITAWEVWQVRQWRIDPQGFKAKNSGISRGGGSRMYKSSKPSEALKALHDGGGVT